MLKEWLQRKVDLEEVERGDIEHFKKRNQESRERHKKEPHLPLHVIPEKPGGFCHEQWVQFRTKIEEGDELWLFESPEETWKQLAGRAGYAILRNGEPIAHYISLMN